jgi:hypothetical protein
MAAYWAVYIVVMVIATALSILLRPKPLVPNLLPGATEEAPIADYGAVLPVLFGRAFIKQPNCVWWGAVRVVPIREKLSSGKS